MIPVILSGGSGHRLWPISRKESPKQFCKFLNKSLFRMTLDRLAAFHKPLVVSNINLKVPTESLLNKSGINMDCIYEPIAKNTAPAVAIAVKYLLENNQADEWVGIFPADHIIRDEVKFNDMIDFICKQNDESIYLLGIKPREPKTGFGYIEVDNVNYDEVCSVSKFHEKPNLETAQSYIKKGNFLWNSGIFIFKLKTLIKYFERTNSQLWQQINQIKDFSNFSQIYNSIKANSFDHEVLEHFDNIKCIPTDLPWSDVGTWDEFSKVIEQKDSYKNEIVELGAKNNYYFSNNKKIITAIDVEDLIVVDSPDSLLICKKGSSEKVKQSLSEVKNQQLLANHSFELRPWGQFEVLSDELSCKVKKIKVFPGHKTSYQMHRKRDEQWTITMGSAEVTLNGHISTLKKGDSIHIPANCKHRIANNTNDPVEFIEVQTGAYFGEDDIIRYQDEYGRVPNQI